MATSSFIRGFAYKTWRSSLLNRMPSGPRAAEPQGAGPQRAEPQRAGRCPRGLTNFYKLHDLQAVRRLASFISDQFQRCLLVAAMALASTTHAALVPIAQAQAQAQAADAKEEAAAKPPARPVFKDGEAQIVEAFKDEKDWLRHDLWVETDFDSDGDGRLDRVHVAVTRPKQTDTEGLRLPVVYETSPYFAGTGSNDRQYFWNPRQAVDAPPPERRKAPRFSATGQRPIISNSLIHQWVPRGYIVVHSSSPGTGLSQGCPTVGGQNESLAPKAVIDWLCSRAKGFTEVDGDETVLATWCSGSVGMTGTSYNGTLPLAAATTGVDGLKAIIPIAPNTSYYHYYRSNGLVRHPGGYIGEDIDVLYEFIRSGNPSRRDYCDCQVRDTHMRQGMDRELGDMNQFWRSRDYLHAMPHMKAALLMAHAFNDWNVMPEHSVRIYEAAKRQGLPTQIYFHQGGHGGPPPMPMMNRWFTRYLHEQPNGVEQAPRAWIVREADKREEPTAYTDYPNPDAHRLTFHLQRASGRRGDGQHGTLTLQPEGMQGTESLIDNYSFSGEALAQAEVTRHRLLYATPILTSPLHISGHIELQARVACDRKAANFSVWLVSLPWNDKRDARVTDNIITRGWADPQNHAGLTESEPLQIGRFYDLQFELQPDDQLIAAGQQLGLMIFSSDREFTLHPDPGTELTIDLDATHISLPIVGGLAAYERAMERPPQPQWPGTP